MKKQSKGFSSRCAMCKHPERVRAELLIAGGASIQSVAKLISTHYDSVRRHWAKHVSDERRAALTLGPVTRERLASRVGEESESILDHLKASRSAIYQVLDAALTAGDANGVAQLARVLHENLREMARLTGQIANSPMLGNTTNIQNIFVTPEFARLQMALLEALRPHAAARADVVRALRSLEAQTTPAALPQPSNRIIEMETANV